MRPLIFLTTRSVVNGIKRAFSSPKRMISLIAFALYYFFVVMRPMATSYGPRHSRMPTEFAFNLPPMEVLQAFIFAGFALLTILLALSTSVQRMSFRPADVDVLFATPI